ncbi:MAG: glycosyltransferase, partial [Glaciimonas sp.]|nr:glycosyltransferase [Glaciimonas sp.]
MELLRAAQPAGHDIDHIVVWGGKPTLKALEAQPWLSKRNPPALDKGLLQRTLWQRYRLSQAARDEGCDVLFVPGGSYAGNFHPVVTMSQNLLPFEMPELLRYGWTLFMLRLLLLRLTQSRSFRKADGVIFLTEYARDVVLRVTGKLRGQTCIVPHGLNPRFNKAPKLQCAIAEYDDAHPYRVLYVSIIDQYKHQWHVVEAVAALRKQGFPIVLDLVGPAYPPALKRLNQTIDRVDAVRRWVHYHGAIPFNELHLRYAEADLGLFASSCENMPNILLETMASGLPI